MKKEKILRALCCGKRNIWQRNQAANEIKTGHRTHSARKKKKNRKRKKDRKRAPRKSHVHCRYETYKSGQACAVVRFASQLAFHSMPKSLCFLLSFIVLLFVRGESFVKFISSNTTDTKWNDDDTHTPNKSSFLPFFFIFFSAFSLQIKQFWEFSLQVFAFHCVLCLHRIQSQKLRDPATSTSCISPSDLTFNFWASNRLCGCVCVCVGRFSLNRVHLHRSVFEVD